MPADDVQTLTIPRCAQWVAEETPEEMLAALTTLLAPYRDGTAAVHNPGPQGAEHRPLAAGDDGSARA